MGGGKVLERKRERALVPAVLKSFQTSTVIPGYAIWFKSPELYYKERLCSCCQPSTAACLSLSSRTRGPDTGCGAWRGGPWRVGGRENEIHWLLTAAVTSNYLLSRSGPSHRVILAETSCRLLIILTRSGHRQGRPKHTQGCIYALHAPQLTVNTGRKKNHSKFSFF